MIMPRLLPLLAFMTLALLATPGDAQDTLPTANTPGPVRFLVEPYLLMPNMQGTIGLGELPDLPLDADPGDILGKLKAGFMLYLEARNVRWAATSDLLYMRLEQEATPNELIHSGNAAFSQFAFELAGLRRVLPGLEVGLGGRFNSLNADVELQRNAVGGGVAEVTDENENAAWFDPVIIARATSTIGKWHLQFRGDVGGFGVGSDLTYQLQAHVGYRFSPLFQLTTGYRLIYMDYAQGSGATSFRYDMSTFGPLLRLGFEL